ncbi:MAG: hypothetical protein GX564_05510 [Oligosphaeraceae bacterium]|jgi:hypothetical protein|nr:hypothetical protein [Oligosphaeraceae bacterium]
MITAAACLDCQKALLLHGPELGYNDLNELRKIITADLQPRITADLEDFRRAGNPVRLAQLGAILAASDCPEWSPADTACIGWNGESCTQANRTYWDDFLAHGRETGRGMFFVPTLPSIPACEAAITLKIHGPVWYFSTAADTGLLFAALEDLLQANPTLRQVLVAEIHASAACLLLWRPSGTPLPRCQTLKELFFHLRNCRSS